MAQRSSIIGDALSAVGAVGAALRGIPHGIRNDVPVPIVSRSNIISYLLGGRIDAEHMMASMGSNGTLFAIVDATSTAVASNAMTFKLYRKARSGKKEDRVEITSHAVLDLLNNPNGFTTRQELFEAGQQHQDLVGETWVVFARAGNYPVPLEAWVIRPDRMRPVVSPTKYILGYIYTSPDGEEVPLETRDVMFLRKPNPLDPYRGMGAVQSVLTTMDSMRYSAEWNRNFFRNSAQPGGMIKVTKRLGNEQWQEMRERWAEQHKGLSNAHRVGILEDGAEWVDAKYSMRDMEFAALNGISREVVREAFRFPKPMLGTVEDVNRANADAAEVVFARWLTVPRMDRWKGGLNSDLLPLYGDTAKDCELDYDSPVPEDEEAERAERDSKVGALKILLSDLRVKPADAFKFLDLPEMEIEPAPEPPAPVLPPTIPPPGVPAPEPVPADVFVPWAFSRRGRLVAHVKGGGEVDLTQVQADWEEALAELLSEWGDITQAQRDEIMDQVRHAINDQRPDSLATLTVSSIAGGAILAAAMTAHAEMAAQRVVEEAAAQDVLSDQGVPDSSGLTILATTIAALLAVSLANAAGREAVRHYSRTADGQAVADAVDAHIAGLSDAYLRTELGAALTSAQNAGRMATLRVAPVGALYASEVMDSNTCKPCREVDGRWLGNTDGPDVEATVDAAYPNGGYISCLGGNRCRGTIVGVWRPAQTDETKG